MNQKEIEKEIWRSLLIIVDNFSDFDAPEYGRLRHGFVDDEWDHAYGEPLEPKTSKAHQERFDKAQQKIVNILRKKVIK